MGDLERKFSIGTLSVGDLAIRVRYQRCRDDAFGTAGGEEGQRRGTGSPSTPSTHPTGAARPACKGDEDDEDGNRFDATGLLVWPGSRLLASFLVDPSGARRLLPQVFRSGFGRQGTTRPTASDECKGNGIAREGQNVGSSRPASWNYGRHDGLTSGGQLAPGGDACFDEQPLLSKNGTTTIPHPVSKMLSEQAPVADMNLAARQAPQRSPVILELGAGTGICGIAASLSFGCPVILTDRRKDVLANLQGNISLNGLGKRAQVVRLSWGGAEIRTGQMPVELIDKSPFKVILASDTVYPGKPLSDAKAFFDLVSTLLDTGGVLLLAYTPRQPSIGTENMLRCAYQAGLTEKMLLDKTGGSWKMGGGPESEVWVGDGSRPAADSRQNEQQRQDGNSGNLTPDTPVEETNGRRGHISYHRVDDSTQKTVFEQVDFSSGRRRPVLLAFGFSPGSSQRDIISAGKAEKYAHPGQACSSESAWLGEWEYIFPELSKKIKQSNVARESLVSVVQQQQHLDEVSSDGGGGPVSMDLSNAPITADYLWWSTGGDGDK